MRKELLLLGAFGMLTTATLCAQEFHLQPTPQEYITQKDSVGIKATASNFMCMYGCQVPCIIFI